MQRNIRQTPSTHRFSNDERAAALSDRPNSQSGADEALAVVIDQRTADRRLERVEYSASPWSPT